VGHEGRNSSGEFLYSLNATDVPSGWAETEALRNRAQIWTFQALERIKQRLPFPAAALTGRTIIVMWNRRIARWFVAWWVISGMRRKKSRSSQNRFISSPAGAECGKVKDRDGEAKRQAVAAAKNKENMLSYRFSREATRDFLGFRLVGSAS